MPTAWISMPRSWFHSSSRTLAMYRPSSRPLEATKEIRIPSADIWLMAVWKASIYSLRYCSLISSIST